jgi:hypothetical protein
LPRNRHRHDARHPVKTYQKYYIPLPLLRVCGEEPSANESGMVARGVDTSRTPHQVPIKGDSDQSRMPKNSFL